MTRKTLFTIIQLVFFSAIGGGIVWYMLAHMSASDQRDMLAAIEQTNVLWLIPFFFLYVFSHWARAKRWMLMLDPAGIHPKTSNTVLAVLVGYLVNLIPPRAGEVAKCTILARYEKMPADKMIGTIVAERGFDVICLVGIIAFGIYWQGDALDTYLTAELKGHTPTVGKLMLIAAIIIGIVALLVLLYKRNKNSKLGRFIGGLRDGFVSIFQVKRKGLFVVYTFLIWGAYLAELVFGFLAIPATANLGLGAAFMCLIFGSVAIVAAPGGLGLYPFLIGKLLHFGYGLSAPAANAFGWVSWAALTVATIIAGVVSLLLLPFINRKIHDAKAPVDTGENP
ncbi:MAG: lysylphosphatidylglycerol synthase transmembrane domain-containing protein [Chitinophagaceae bacterium]